LADPAPETVNSKPTHAVGEATPADGIRILAAASEILSQGELLLSSVPACVYATKLPVTFQSSIGGHYRHGLDHFSSVLAGLATGLVDYENRQRDSRIENEPDYALALTRRLRAELAEIDPSALWTPVTTRCEVSYSRGPSALTASTLGRELVYVVAHAIHHYALISVMTRLQNVELPPSFGVAPSTLAHQQALADG